MSFDTFAAQAHKSRVATTAVDEWAAKQPDKTFIHYGDGNVRLTYAEFKELTDRLAGNLESLRLGRGCHVSVLMRNPFVTIQWMFAIWKAGYVFAPVNFSLTGRLLSYILNDTKPALLVIERSLVPALNDIASEVAQKPAVVVYDPGYAAASISADDTRLDSRFVELEYADFQRNNPGPSTILEPHDIANIIYTSGTTGPSKGAVHRHRWIDMYTMVMRSLLTPEDIVYNDLPMYHVAGAFANVTRAGWAGATVTLWDKFSASQFWDRVQSSGATCAVLVDVMLPGLLSAPESQHDRANTLNKVYMQPLPSYHHSFASRFGIDFVWSAFGQTESGIMTFALLEETLFGAGTPLGLYHGLDHQGVHAVAQKLGISVLDGAVVDRKGTAGKPLPHYELMIADNDDDPCPPETVGQILVRTKIAGTLMKEYLEKPEVTTSAFANLWFHSGDSGVLDEAGNLYFVDRLGDRIRVRGENLSSFLIEDLVNQHPKVNVSAAFAIPATDGSLEDDIVLFATAVEGSALNSQELLDHTESVMPKYMRPKHIRIVEDLPKTATNKVQKYKLREFILNELKIS